MAVTAFLPHKVCGQRSKPPFFLQKSLVSRLFLLNLHRAFECSRAVPYGYAYAYAAELLSLSISIKSQCVTLVLSKKRYQHYKPIHYVMKKNLMNAALLGLLVVAAPACTFVSCKDYDDDFNKVNNRLDGLEAAKTQINTEITSLKSDLQKANEKATQLEAKLAEYATKTELQNGLATKADKKDLETAVNNLSAKIAEVAKLETRIQALETAKAELTALVNAKVDKKAYDAKVADIEGRLTAAQSKATLAADKANTLEQTLNTLKNKVDNQLVALDKFNEKVAALEGKDAELQKKLDELKNTVTEKVAALKKDVKTLQDAGYQTAAQVDAKVNPVAERVGKLETALDMLRVAKVTSLVLQPDHFEGGVESIISTDYVYKALEKLDKADEKGVVEFKAEGEATGEDLVKNFALATYHVNPSSAKVDENKENFAFVSLRPTTRTSASEHVTVTSVDYDAAKGELNVGFHNSLDAEGQNEDGNEEINVVALSYTEKDGTTARTVVSDYARVVASQYDKLRIGKVSEADVIAPEFLKKAGAENLTELAADKKEERTFTVLNDGTSAQLAEQVRSYGENGGVTAAIDDNAAQESVLKAAGFTYKYALVKDGADDKSTDAFTINPNTGELKVKFDAEKPFQHVGKKAVVRVTLVDANGKVASVGYFYARVASPAKVVANLVVEDELKVVCDKNSVHPELSVDLEPLTKYLAKNFGMKEADVWKNGLTNNFTIKTPDNVHEQFTVKDGVATPVPVAQRLGTLLRQEQDAQGKNILKWSGLTEEKVANLRRAGESVSVILQVIKKDQPEHVVLYFEVKWAPKSIQAQPEVAFTGKPVDNWWYQNQNVAAEQEQRMHVSIDGKNTFSHDLTKGFLPNSVTAPALDATKYPTDIKNDVTSAWKFVAPRVTQAKGTDGKTYKLSVSENGTQFLAEEMKDGKVVANATKHELAEITSAGVITYKPNAVSKALLNYAGYNELKDGQTLTARVAYVTTACDGKKVLNVTEATKKYAEFDVKFIRPLDVNYTGQVAFGDANQANQEAEINFEGAIKDWRQVAKLSDLKSAYGELAVGFAPEEEWTTNLNGGDLETVKLKATFGSTYGVSVAADPAGTPVADGEFKGYKEYVFGTYPKLKYVTNTANLKKFTIRIPVYVKYHWGEIKSHIDVQVGKTMNQSNARRK